MLQKFFTRQLVAIPSAELSKRQDLTPRLTPGFSS